MEIVFYPDPVLQRPAADVEPGGPRLRELAEEMIRTMKEASGVGLAAPQVGESIRLFVASETGEPEDAIVCVNPRVEPFGAIVELEEGCLSVPGVRRDVRRPEGVRIVYRDLDGREHREEYHELMARILQHEYDHIEGVLFMERMSEADRLAIRPDLEALEEQYRPR
jgi:peptide deformylase